MNIFGETRTRVRGRHALIAADGYVPSNLPGISGAMANVVISPAMGAGLTQLLLTFEPEGRAVFPESGIETCVFLIDGGCKAAVGGRSETLAGGGFVFCPAGARLELSSAVKGTRAIIFQKHYEGLDGAPEPEPVFGNEEAIEAIPFLGDPAARLKTLLPETPSFDMAVNLFTFQPGARLPFVETHVMEHGLVILEGEGVYRLEEDWYPVCAGDSIWMAPYCPQWFVAMGNEPTRYLYYKDINRSPMA